jgi:hypothetical protein
MPPRNMLLLPVCVLISFLEILFFKLAAMLYYRMLVNVTRLLVAIGCSGAE